MATPMVARRRSTERSQVVGKVVMMRGALKGAYM
jgi:hypothetical protein